MKASLTTEAKCFICLNPSGLLKVSFPFDAVTNAQLAKIRPKGTFCGGNKGWEFPFDAVQVLLAILSKRFVITDSVLQWTELLKKPLPELPGTNEFLQKGNFYSQLSDGRIPFPHQCEGAKWLLHKRRALLADEMGLGKTLTALLAARAIARCIDISVMIIAPVGLHSHWIKEANTIGLKINLYSWAKIPSELSDLGTLLIVDEAHFAQSISAKRTKALLKLSRHPYLRFIWLLTGTPLKNGRPKEIYPLLLAIKHPIANNKKLYNNYFAEESNTSSYQQSISMKSIEIISLLIKPFILARKKNQIFGLPPKTRKKHKVLLSKKEEIGFNYCINLAVDNYRIRVAEGLVSKNAEPLAILSAMRRITAEYKLSAIIKFLRIQKNCKNPVVLFSNFLQPLYLLNKYEKGQLLTGNQTIMQREKIVRDFQLGKLNLLLCTYGAASLGFTLHRARNVILMDRPWSPGELNQAEDRCHRIGMEGALMSHWFELGFVDQFIDNLIINKHKNIQIILGKREIEIERKPLPEMIHNLLMQLSG